MKLGDLDPEIWLSKYALPLWSESGYDYATGTVWESLSHDGIPEVQKSKRLRVQARQAFCFATAADYGADPDSLIKKALSLVKFIFERGVDRNSRYLASTLHPDGVIETARHDLYDVCFVLLAISALLRRGQSVDKELAQAIGMLDELKAQVGWAESKMPHTIRRQNPHMHLFECSTELFSVTGAPQFKRIADECLDLFKRVFLQPDGNVFEYFTLDWKPLDLGQSIEPGHMMEWIYLIDKYENITNQSCDIDLGRIFEKGCSYLDTFSLLPDSALPLSNTRRLWPQTEFLKASVVIQRRSIQCATKVTPCLIFDTIQSEYLQGAATGGWYDRRTVSGELISDNMPASTFYHTLLALLMYSKNQGSTQRQNVISRLANPSFHP